MWHGFVTKNLENYTLDDNDDLTYANIVKKLAMDFCSFLDDSYESLEDEYLMMVAGFVKMATLFSNFVEAYRTQDSISIEQGYQQFAPVWKVLSQHKYLQCWIEQLDQLYVKHPYSVLQEYRMNRTHRSYPACTGKRAVALDEYIEVCNQDLAIMPTIRSLDGYIRQGLMVGVCKRCKRANEQLYGPGELGDRTVYRSGTGSVGNQTPGKRVIYIVASRFLGQSMGTKKRKMEGDSFSVHSKDLNVVKLIHQKKLDKEI